MKRNFTKLLAALAMLAFLIAPLAMNAETTTVTASKITSSSVTWTGSAGETWNVTINGGATNQNVTSDYAQFGTKNSPSTSGTFSTSGISGTISSIAVDCASYNGLGTVSVTVGGAAFGSSQLIPSWSSNAGGTITFSGSASGNIVVTMTNASNGRAMYIKSITVTYTTSGGGTSYTVTAAKETGISTAYVAAGSSFSGTSTSVSVSSGGNATFQATVASGYTFDGWYNGSSRVSTDLTYTYSNITSALTLTAKATVIPTHTVTFSINGNTSNTATFAEGEAITFPSDPADILDYTFMGWVEATINGTTNTPPTFVTSATMGTQDVTYYACFALGSSSVDEVTKTYGFETESDSDWTINGPVRTSGNENSGSYSGRINTNHTYVQFNSKVKVKEFSFAFKKTSNNDNYSVIIETSSDNSTWTEAETYAMSSFLNGTYSTRTKEFNGTTELYVRFHCYNTTAVRYVDDVTIKYSNAATSYSNYCTTVSVTVTAPTVTTNSTATSTTETSITCGGMVTSTGNAATTRGICYMEGTTGDPTTSNTCVAASGTTTTNNSTFEVTLTGLSAGTSYRCRAYATNSAGTSYGDTYTFQTVCSITALSNNDSWGTVSLDGTTITASANPGYTLNTTTPYTVTSGTATVTQSGNTFSVNATTNCTITINFEAIPTHTASFSVDGSVTSQDFAEGAAITFPSNPADIDGKTFMGWITYTIDGTTDTPPTFVNTATETMGSNDITYYACFAEAAGSGSDTYEQLASNSFDPNATYVIGAAQSSSDNTMWYLNYYSAVDANASWGVMTNDPENDAPIQFTLSGTASALVAQDDRGNYLVGLTSKNFKMSSTQTTVALSASGTILSSDNSPWSLRHNYTSGGLRWYETATGTSAYFYKVVSGVTYSNYTTTTFTIEKQIIGYGTGNGKWHLITSPLTSVEPTAVTNMIPRVNGTPAVNSTDYDLYCFDATKELEWVNYKESSANGGGFSLVAGKGYLYANKGDVNNDPNTVTLSFTGAPYSGNGQVTLTNTGTGNFAGWNLVGNPFTGTAYVDRAYYVMNENGDGFIAAEREKNYVNPMEGIFVYAATSTTMTFSTTAPQPDGNNAILALNLSQGQGVMDRAIVRFDNSNTLPKLQLWGNTSQVYIPVDGKDYAVVNAQGQGELPVSFKAKENGTYTLSTNTKDVNFGYLHLIDNLTGNDVDLLATPSYSFEAKTNDYANRFKLVFATTCGDEDGDNDFAFFSNGSLVVNNPSTGSGAATLQVIDVNGRILKSESINGCANVNLNAAPGVYMIRLVNGNDVKTQKIVVR